MNVAEVKSRVEPCTTMQSEKKVLVQLSLSLIWPVIIDEADKPVYIKLS